jgi:ABC-type transport system substrate-binding protein
LDRNAVIERAMPNAAVTADSPLMPGSWAYESDLPWPLPNADAARQILENVRIRPASAEATEEPEELFCPSPKA